MANPANKEDSRQESADSAQITHIRSGWNNEAEVLKEDDLLNESAHFYSKTKGTQRALVVDDSPSVRKQLELELELFDVDVDYAATAKEAMELLEHDEYDVAFLDVVLPDK